MPKKKKQVRSNKSMLPKGVLVISYLLILAAIFNAIVVIYIVFSDPSQLSDLVGILTVLSNIITIAIQLILGIFLLKRKNWARIVAIIIFILTAISGFFTLATTTDLALIIVSVVYIILGILIAAYLIKSKKVKEVFKK